MKNNQTGNYGHNDRTPQQNQNFSDQRNRDNNQAKNAKDANANAQRSPENGRDSNTPSSASGSDTVNQIDVEIGKRLEYQDAENTNLAPNPGDRISDPENVNDPNMERAANKATDHNLQGTSRKADHSGDYENRE